MTLAEVTALPVGTTIRIVLAGEAEGAVVTRIGAGTTESMVVLEPVEDDPHFACGGTIGAAIGSDPRLFYGKTGDDPHLGWFFHCRVELT